MKNLNKKMIGAVLFIAGIMSISGSVIIVSTPVTQTTIQNGIDIALSGDVVSIPAGEWNIYGTVNLKEGIHVRGAGMDSTILNKIDATSTSMFKLIVASGAPFKVSEINFKGIGLGLFIANPYSTVRDIGVEIYGKATEFEIYNCRFENFCNAGIYLYGASGLIGHPTGVIHDNEFKDNFWATSTSSLGYGVVLYGDNSWPVLQLGDANAVFVENNYFQHNKHCIAANYGGRYVFRSNIVQDNYYPYPAIDAHGKTTSYHGTRSYEIYWNTVSGGVEWPSHNSHPTLTVGIRGGDGVIWDNEWTGMWRAMYICVENWNSGMLYPVADQIRNLWSSGNTLDGISDNTFSIGLTAQDEINYAPYLQEGRDFHEGTPKPGYEAYIYPHPICNLRGHWTLDNANSIQVDVSASGNNCTMYGNPVSSAGKCGNALDFNGTSDYLLVPYTSELNAVEFTVSAWVKVEGGSDTYRGLISSRTYTGGCKGYNIYAGSNNKWQFWTGNGTSFQVLYDPAVTNEWTYIVATHSGTTNKLYVNGIEYSGTGSVVVNDVDLFRIGVVGAYRFNGLIDDVRYYSKALSPQEIKSMYNQIPDSSFESDLGDKWVIFSGVPTLDSVTKYDGNKSLCFSKATSGDTNVSVDASYYIPINPSKTYILSVYAKGQNIVQGDNWRQRLYITGRWFDKNMNELSGLPDLSINTGTFDWTKFETTVYPVSGAAYYRITNIGIAGTASGTGWVDMIGLRPSVE